MNLKTKIAVTTFTLFMVEAVMHYNQGKRDCKEFENKPNSIIPPTKSLLKLALIVGAFSVINGIVIDEIK